MPVKITKVLRKLDAFGFPINFYYQSNDSKMRSIFGSLATVITVSLLTYYFVFLAMRIQDPEHQSISYNTFTVDLNEEPEFEIN